MKDNTNGWLVVALLFGFSTLCQTWVLGYNYAESECQAVLEENNDE